MSPSLVTALWALSLARLAMAQGGAYNQTTWGAVVMAFHGDREPLITSGAPALTPLGAQQAFEAGSVVRTRWVAGPDTNITRSFPIHGLATNMIDNTQLFLLAADDDYVAGSSMAFVQGVYPPLGSGELDQFMLANGTSVGWPLGGYQYPTIDTISSLDFNFVWIAGDVECPQYDLSTYQYFETDDYQTTAANFDGFYKELIPILYEDVVPDSQVSYYNAYDLWDFADYQYTHNATVRDTLSPVYLQQLHDLASQSQFAINGNLSASGLYPNDHINAVAGRTFAGKVLSLLQQNIGSNGLTPKLSLLFGGFPPFLAFFSLSGLADTGDEFKSLPLDGSVMAFELFSNTADNSTFPDVSELWVRFLFRNGSDADAQLLSHPLFDRGNSAIEMTWSDFEDGMNAIALNSIGDWCNTCSSLSMFCSSFTDNTTPTPDPTTGDSTSSKKQLSAPVAGVVGAVVTIAVLVILMSAAVLCCGVRFHRHDRNRQSSLGGFKGAEKLASDTDLTIATAGKPGSGAGASVIRHERVGSWELGEARKSDEERDISSGAGSSKHQSLDRVVSMADYSKRHEEDADDIRANPFGDPVKIDDRI